MALSFPVVDFERDETAWPMVSVRGAGSERRVRTWGGWFGGDDAPVFVGVQDAGGAPGTWGKVEFNPARLSGEHPSPSTVESLTGAARAAAGTAGELLTPAASLSDWRLKRLDVARDFQGVGSPSFYVRGLLPVHRPWARRSMVYSDPQRNLAETLFVGSGSGGCRLYDKHRENEGVPAGTVRWEVEARSEWLHSYGGMATLGDVSKGLVVGLAENRWRWSGMGSTVSAGESLVLKVQGSELGPAAGRAFLGWLVEGAFGVDSDVAPATAAKYRKLARDLGVCVSADAFGGDLAVTGRLDLELGCELVQVAA